VKKAIGIGEGVNDISTSDNISDIAKKVIRESKKIGKTTTLYVVRPFTALERELAKLPQEDLAKVDFNELTNNTETEITELYGINFKTTPSQKGVYSIGEGLAIGGEFNMEGQSKTFIIKEGNLEITSNLKITNGFAAFIVQKGNIIIGGTVTKMEGVYIAQKGIFEAERSEKQLTVNGAFIGDINHLWKNRKYIGTDESKLERVQPAINIRFDARLFTQTPPGLEKLPTSTWELK
jgi:hypothetical protein